MTAALHRVLCRIGIHDWYPCPYMRGKRLRFWHCDYCGGSKTTVRPAL